MTRRRIEVHVDEVVLHGVTAANRPAAIAALRERLAQLAAQPDMYSSNGPQERLDGGVIQAGAPKKRPRAPKG